MRRKAAWGKKAVVVGYGAVLSLGMALGAHAGSVIEEVKAYINREIKLTVNGEEWTPKDADGIAQSPLIYNGSAYVPLRSVGALTGLAIDWDEDTQTIAVFTPRQAETSCRPADEPGKNAAGFGDAEYSLLNKTLRLASDITAVQRGRGCLSFPIGKSDPGGGSAFEIGYSLYGAAKRVHGKAAVTSTADAEVRLRIVDNDQGKVLFERSGMRAGDEPVAFDVDVTNVKELGISAYTSSEPGTASVMIQSLTVVANKTVPEETFDITKPNRPLPGK
ncbi:stalk domain-containing protein [Paenibacillus hamazuiensis]|uniref:stalk domain-containing protein n=1 Tax=Paenibacillus hamazuiensis TaxID=2936508 RepID=UPI00200E470E|nr:stalk domain-containing protein [Paenibacillus hamazuiensis]